MTHLHIARRLFDWNTYFVIPQGKIVHIALRNLPAVSGKSPAQQLYRRMPGYP